MTIDWDHVYLLGWYDANNKAYLTTWQGDLPYVDVVVKTGIGSQSYFVPMWNAPIGGQEIEPMLSAAQTIEEKIRYATDCGGVYAFGWYIENKIERLAVKT